MEVAESPKNLPESSIRRALASPHARGAAGAPDNHFWVHAHYAGERRPIVYSLGKYFLRACVWRSHGGVGWFTLGVHIAYRRSVSQLSLVGRGQLVWRCVMSGPAAAECDTPL